MNSAEKIEETPNVASNAGPGERLQAARIEQGLTIDDVANRMHLSKTILESIEENDFDEITAPIFVKGYLRAYARIVSLDEEELIQQYMDLFSNEDPPISSTSNTVREISTDDARIKWMTFLVVIVLLALLAVWWWNKDQGMNESVSLDVQQPDVVENNNIDETTDNGVDMTEVVVAIEAESEQELVEAISEVDESGASTISDEPIESSTITSVEESTDGASETEVPESSESLNIAPELSDSAAEEPIVETTATALETKPENRLRRQAPGGNDKVILVVHADTWADIKDNNKHRLIYDLLRAGQSFELIGQAPFSIFFGNGHGVEVVYNGNQIDVLSETRDDNTARLKLGN